MSQHVDADGLMLTEERDDILGRRSVPPMLANGPPPPDVGDVDWLGIVTALVVDIDVRIAEEVVVTQLGRIALTEQVGVVIRRCLYIGCFSRVSFG